MVDHELIREAERELDAAATEAKRERVTQLVRERRAALAVVAAIEERLEEVVNAKPNPFAA